MYLVYEKNYLTYGDVDCVEESDMKLWKDKKNAEKDMRRRKAMYISNKDNGFTFMKDESSKDCFVFADELHVNEIDRNGEFHICLTELDIEDEY